VIAVQTLRYGVVLSLLLVFLGVSGADDLIKVSIDDANGIAQVVADTFTEYTGVEWVALSPVELRDDSTDELVGYLYLVTNDLEAGATTIEGLETEVVKAYEAYPRAAYNREQQSEFDNFRYNYITLVVASECTKCPIINNERCGFASKLFGWIYLQKLGGHIRDTNPTNYHICSISCFEQYGDWNSIHSYIKYIVKSAKSGDELTLLDGFHELSIEDSESHKIYLDVINSLWTVGLFK
jgi:hypothetical protein